ncbi:MAG: redoxin family protein, partial [Nitrospirota bacterium]
MPLKIGDPAPAFSLPGTDGRTYSLDGLADKPVLVVLFSCNHCPY